MPAGLKNKCKIYFSSSNSEAWIGGVNYFYNLFHAISMSNDENIEIYANKRNPDKIFKYANPFDFRGFKYRLSKVLCTLSGKKFDKHEYARKVSSKKFDVVSHCMNHYELGKNSISWIADFQHKRLPYMFKEDEIKERDENYYLLARDSKLVILSSLDALNDFKTYYPEFANKGRVLNFVSYIEPTLYEISQDESKKIIEKFDLSERYFYIPNQFWKHKNHIVVFKALSKLKQEGINVNLVLSGYTGDYRNKEHFKELIKFIEENNIKENVKFLGVIEMNEVYYLLRNCVSIINPSLFEGWSTTVEEAKSLGKNIILSNLNVHKEQNPQNAIFFDPNNEDELKEILKNKWEEGHFGPDFELEDIARKNMDSRMIEFGTKYREILKECLENK